MTTPRKKLIEVALPLEAINAASAREKSIRHGHPSTLHLWWARRPLAACRAVIFTSLVDDPDDPDAPPEFVAACKKLPRGKNAAETDTPRQRLFDFIELLVQWKSTTDEKVLETARELIRLSTDGNPPPLLDPFAGGGSIPLEAQRLGLEAHASDLNPVAVMINKALIEIPPKFANMPPVNPRDRAGTAAGGSWNGAAGLAADVRYYGEWMRNEAWERIGHLYPKCNGETVIAWLWARTVKSPNPAVNIHVPLVRSFWLSKKKGNESWLKPDYDSNKNEIIYKVINSKGSPPKGTIYRGSGRCIVSGAPIPGDYIRKASRDNEMGVDLLAIATQGPNGRKLHHPNAEHIQVALQANPQWFPSQQMNPNASDLVSGRGYGFYVWADLFTKRQLDLLSTFVNLLSSVKQHIIRDAVDNEIRNTNHTLATSYAESVIVYLALSVSKLTVSNNSFARWRAGETKTAPAFGRQALAMVWDYAETNPFAGAGGDFYGIVDGIARTIETLPAKPISNVTQTNAANLTLQNATVISTDPPYYDNINYGDLSDFSYVWLRPMLRDLYPSIFSTLLVPKDEELVAISYRFDGDQDVANKHFEQGLNQVFTNLNRFVENKYPMSVFYAFRQTETELTDSSKNIQVSSTGWETMLEGLMKSGFSIAGTWPMRTEGKTRLIASGTNALASSIILVCRPRPENAPMTSRREFVNALRRDLPAALREMQSGNIAPVDLAQASIGPGMAVYSRYSKVLEPDGSPLTVRTALQIINQELDAYLAEQEGEMDSDSRFAISWFQQFGFDEGGFGQADVLARAKNTSVEGMVSAGVLESGAGVVRLLGWSELDPGWDPESDTRLTVWETVHHLIERLNTYGEEGAARLLAKLSPEMSADARQMAYRLYSLCERKGWAEHARDYNALVVSWGASQEQARELKEQYQQGQLL